MSGFLATLARRALGQDALLAPRLPGLFEDEPASFAEIDVETVVPPAVDRTAHVAPGAGEPDQPAPVSAPIVAAALQPPAPAVAGRAADLEGGVGRPVTVPAAARAGAAHEPREVRTIRTATAVERATLERTETLRIAVAAVPVAVRERILRADPARTAATLSAPQRPEGARTAAERALGRREQLAPAALSAAARLRAPDGESGPDAAGIGAATEPTVEVTIGRVEVRAAVPSRPVRRAFEAPPAPRVDLETYLRERSRS